VFCFEWKDWTEKGTVYLGPFGIGWIDEVELVTFAAIKGRYELAIALLVKVLIIWYGFESSDFNTWHDFCCIGGLWSHTQPGIIQICVDALMDISHAISLILMYGRNEYCTIACTMVYESHLNIFCVNIIIILTWMASFW